jgi:ribonuclease HII
LKIHRRIESKIQKELQYVDQKRKIAETDLEEQKRTVEKLVQNKNETNLITEAQKQETGIANQTIAKMHQGNAVIPLCQANTCVQKSTRSRAQRN